MRVYDGVDIDNQNNNIFKITQTDKINQKEKTQKMLEKNEHNTIQYNTINK